jgi:nicotinic acid phosphoribosyltransferase
MAKTSKRSRLSKTKRRYKGGSCPCGAGSGLFKGGNDNDCAGVVKIGEVEERMLGGKKKPRQKMSKRKKTRKAKSMKGGLNWSNNNAQSYDVFSSGTSIPQI